ncbi:MAG: hypothetical protein WC819_04345 [Parcubacteria group bacterium]|jgi:hypothetical protein
MTEKPFTLLSLPTVKNTRQVIKKFPFPIALTKGSYPNIVIFMHNGKVRVLHNDVDTSTFSFVWLSSGWSQRDIAYAINLYFNHTKTPHSYVEKSSSKVTDCMAFALNGLPMPDTVFVSRSRVEKHLSLIKEVCSFPLIVKDIRGCQGKHSAFISSEAELLEKMTTLPKSKKFLFQRFIPNEYDWGIMVANGVVVAGEKSYPTGGEFRNNTCNGAKECFVNIKDIPENIKKMAIDASDLLGLSWSRTDIIIDKNTGLPYVLEVNRFPGITSESHEVQGAYTFLASHIHSSIPQKLPEK